MNRRDLNEGTASMKSFFPAAVAAAVLAVTAMSTAASAAQELGCRSIGFITDRDVIPIGANDGAFKSIQLRVSGNDISMQDLVVVYGNGKPDELAVREKIRAGGQTRWIDLKGNRRVIKRIEMRYASRLNFKGQAKVCVYGR